MKNKFLLNNEINTLYPASIFLGEPKLSTLSSVSCVTHCLHQGIIKYEDKCSTVFYIVPQIPSDSTIRAKQTAKLWLATQRWSQLDCVVKSYFFHRKLRSHYTSKCAKLKLCNYELRDGNAYVEFVTCGVTRSVPFKLRSIIILDEGANWIFLIT